MTCIGRTVIGKTCAVSVLCKMMYLNYSGNKMTKKLKCPEFHKTESFPKNMIFKMCDQK